MTSLYGRGLRIKGKCCFDKAAIWENTSEKGPVSPTTFSQPIKERITG